MMFGCNPQINLCHFFCTSNLNFFGLTSTKAYFHWVTCERNFSYNFSQIFLKLCRWFCQGLKMCMAFGFNPQIYYAQ